MLRIWGNADSINVQKVLWCCTELGLTYERVDAGRQFRVIDMPAFRALNPNGLVPTIDDDGFAVWESNTIVRYLAAKHGSGTLWPTDVAIRSDADRWMDWANSTLWPTMVPLFRQLYRTPPAARDAAVIAASCADSAIALAVLDGWLARRDYVAGDTFTMAEVALGCGIWRWMAFPIERPPLPHLERWFALLAARPAYRATVMLPLC